MNDYQNFRLKKMQRLFLFIFCYSTCFYAITSLAQTDWSLKPFISYQKGTLNIIEGKTEVTSPDQVVRKEFVFYPKNLSLDPRVSLTYKGLASASINLLSIKPKKDKIDVQLQIPRDKFVFDMHFQKYLGYRMRSLDNINFNPIQDEIFKSNAGTVDLPQMSLVSFGLNATYIWNNPQFSLQPKNNENWENISAGSFLIMLSLTKRIVSNLNSSDDSDVNESLKMVDDFSQTSIGFSPGYAYYLPVFQDYFISGAAFWGGLLTENRFLDSSKNRVGSQQISLRARFGYDLGKDFYGINAMKSIHTTNSGDLSINYSVSLVQLYYGFRF